MKKSLKKALGVYQDFQQFKDEGIWRTFGQGLDAMSDRSTLFRFILIPLSINTLLWLTVIVSPGSVLSVLENGFSISEKFLLIIMAFVVATGGWITYSLLRLKFPTIEESRMESKVFGTFEYQSDSHKHYLIWLTSIAGGVLNLLALISVDLILSRKMDEMVCFFSMSC
jgi:hypothetical protein